MIKQPFYLTYTRKGNEARVTASVSRREAVIGLFIAAKVGIKPLKGIEGDDWDALHRKNASLGADGAVFPVDGTIGSDVPALNDPEIDHRELTRAEIISLKADNEPGPLYAIILDRGAEETAVFAISKRGVIESMVRSLGLSAENLTDHQSFLNEVRNRCKETGLNLFVFEIRADTLKTEKVYPDDFTADTVEPVLEQIRKNGGKHTTMAPIKDFPPYEGSEEITIEDPIEFIRK